MELYKHQSNALEQTKDLNRVAYYHDMGLGKTFTGAEKMVRLGANLNLVICQKSKVQDWVDHFRNNYGCYSDLTEQIDDVLDLTNKKQFELFRHVCGVKQEHLPPRYFCVAVINYELAWRRKELLKLEDFTLMLDESSMITNEHAKRSDFILKMHPDNVILLSGTPTAGKYEKLWSQVQLLGWKISEDAFWKSYVDTKWIENDDGYKNKVIVGYKNVEHLKKKLAKYGALFLKTEEVMTLPDQVVQNIMLEPTTEYKKFRKYGIVQVNKRYVEEPNQSFHDEGEWVYDELVGDNTLTKILYSRQLCGQYHKDKLAAFRDLLESTEDRVIVFYNFTAEYLAMVKIADELQRPQSIVNGKQRQLMNYEKYDNSITFIQYQAGAMGGNYQKANKIIYFTLPLGKGSCDLWEQSKKRIHRIGQDKTCFYYYLLVKNSIEMWNLDALKEGKDYTDELFNKQNN